MKIRQLEYLCSVVHFSSFRRAAAKLNVSEPAVSQGIKQLELELGVELFERSKRGVAVTAAGESFVLRAERILREIRAGRLELTNYAGQFRGKLVVGAAPITIGYFGLGELISHYNRVYPSINLSLREHDTEELLAKISDGEIDVGMMFLSSTGHHGEPSFEVRPLFRTQIVAICREDHPRATPSEISLDDLMKEQLIFSAPGTASRTTIEHAMNVCGLEPEISPNVANNGSLAMHLIAEGAGIGFSLAGFVAHAHPQLRELRITNADVECSAALVLEKRGPRTTAIKAFVDQVDRWNWTPPAL